mgnify:CR=1 FL=1
MKKNKARNLRLLCLIGMAVYCGVCFRSFYLKPELSFAGGVPKNMRASLTEWYAKSEDVKPPKPDQRSLIYALLHPYEPSTVKCHMEYSSRDGSVAVVVDAPGGYWTRLVKDDDEWVVNLSREE